MDKNDTPNDKAKQKPRNFYTEKLKKVSKASPKSKGQYPNTKDKGGGPGETSKDGEKSNFHGRNGGQNQRQRQGYVQQHGLFPEYLPPPQVIAGLKDKTLIEGVLRINAKSYEDAFISSPDPKEQDIYIKVSCMYGFNVLDVSSFGADIKDTRVIILISGYISKKSSPERGCCRGEPRLSRQVEGEPRGDPGLCRDARHGEGEESPDGQLRGQRQGGED